VSVDVNQTPARRRALAQQLAKPLRNYLSTESGSAVVLLGATVLALLWANSPLSDEYFSLWSTDAVLRVGDHAIALDLRDWVNDGLMVFFFFVIGLEVRREITIGELKNRRLAGIPVFAAIAGLAVPALLYLAINPSGEAARGVVMATDTAFVLGALALIGPACPTRLRVFLLTMAIADDIGAVVLIGLFYSEDVDVIALAVAAACGVVIFLLGRLNVWRGPAYFAVGLGLWIAMVESGLHPAIAGLVVGTLVSVYPPRREEVEHAARLATRFRQSPDPALAREAKLWVERSVSPNERLQELLHPWTSFVVVPLFALANAGVKLDGDLLDEAVTSPVTLGVVAGLVLGKPVGILLATRLGLTLRLGDLPRGVSMSQVAGGAALAGIGFTVSLFVIELAFDSSRLQDLAKVGVLVAAAIAALLGWIVFKISARLRGDDAEMVRMWLDPPVDPARDLVRGNPDAPLELVEFADFECPFCGRATGMVEELRERFGDRLRYVVRVLPLTDVHPHAEIAAEAAQAAAAQDRFWDYHDVLFEHQDALEPEDLIGYAQDVGADVDRFVGDLEERRWEWRVREDVESAEASGATGTPTFFVNGRRHRGPYDADTLARELEEPRVERPAAVAR
jgi:NhaA family Na+:H+ antiporter